MNKYLRKEAAGSIDESLSLGTFLRKSPFVEGLKTGLKAGIAGAGIGAGYGALTHHGGRKGTLVGGVSSLVGGVLLGAVSQEIKNRQSEAEMSYHMRRLMGRHPGITLPPEVVARMTAESGGAVVGDPAEFERYQADG